MLDLVSKAVLVRDLVAYQYKCFFTIGHEEAFNAIDHIIKWVMDMPTVGATPVVHGHWIDKFAGEYRCSSCRKIVCIDDEVEFPNGITYDYCPWCGAKMDNLTHSNDSNTLDALGEKVKE